MTDQFAPIPTSLRGRYRITTKDEQPRFRSGLARAGNAMLREEVLAGARQNDAVMRLLLEMDRKLDAILGLMQKDSLIADFPSEGVILQLSGSSLHFVCEHPLRKGEHMELLLLLEELPLRIVPVMATVDAVRQGTSPNGGPMHVYTLSYSCEQEDDREAIIRFVFSETRKRIRQQKSSEEGKEE